MSAGWAGGRPSGILLPGGEGASADVDPDDSLSDLMGRLAEGDLTACDAVLERYEARVRLLVKRMLRRFPGVHRYDDTDDVFQMAALRLHRALGSMVQAGEPPRSVLALAGTMVRRTLLDLARRNRGPWSHAANHDTNVDAGGGHRVEGVASEDEILDRWEVFHAAVEGLPAAEREVVHLAWYMGVDQRTIAGIARCSERTVRDRWRSARARLRAALDGGIPE